MERWYNFCMRSSAVQASNKTSDIVMLLGSCTAKVESSGAIFTSAQKCLECASFEATL